MIVFHKIMLYFLPLPPLLKVLNVHFEITAYIVTVNALGIKDGIIHPIENIQDKSIEFGTHAV